mmetsp:Transcript_6277/g.10818  ORF Transcript_6277/g.10818 Transcript_6277/m.10818 type:complete len:425 (-) Transcript_6277:552-1826(-)
MTVSSLSSQSETPSPPTSPLSSSSSPRPSVAGPSSSTPSSALLTASQLFVAERRERAGSSPLEQLAAVVGGMLDAIRFQLPEWRQYHDLLSDFACPYDSGDNLVFGQGLEGIVDEVERLKHRSTKSVSVRIMDALNANYDEFRAALDELKSKEKSQVEHKLPKLVRLRKRLINAFVELRMAHAETWVRLHHQISTEEGPLDCTQVASGSSGDDQPLSITFKGARYDRGSFALFISRLGSDRHWVGLITAFVKTISRSEKVNYFVKVRWCTSVEDNPRLKSHRPAKNELFLLQDPEVRQDLGSLAGLAAVQLGPPHDMRTASSSRIGRPGEVEADVRRTVYRLWRSYDQRTDEVAPLIPHLLQGSCSSSKTTQPRSSSSERKAGSRSSSTPTPLAQKGGKRRKLDGAGAASRRVQADGASDSDSD